MNNSGKILLIIGTVIIIILAGWLIYNQMQPQSAVPSNNSTYQQDDGVGNNQNNSVSEKVIDPDSPVDQGSEIPEGASIYRQQGAPETSATLDPDAN